MTLVHLLNANNPNLFNDHPLVTEIKKFNCKLCLKKGIKGGLKIVKYFSNSTLIIHCFCFGHLFNYKCTLKKNNISKLLNTSESTSL